MRLFFSFLGGGGGGGGVGMVQSAWLLGVCGTMSIPMPRLGTPEVSSSH